MSKLRLSASPIPGETAMSLASRLAWANLVPLREFLGDMGISLKDLIERQRHILERLAKLSGVSVAELRRGTPEIRDGEAWFAGIAFPPPASEGRRCAGASTASQPGRDCLATGPCLSSRSAPTTGDYWSRSGRFRTNLSDTMSSNDCQNLNRLASCVPSRGILLSSNDDSWVGPRGVLLATIGLTSLISLRRHNFAWNWAERR